MASPHPDETRTLYAQNLADELRDLAAAYDALGGRLRGFAEKVPTIGTVVGLTDRATTATDIAHAVVAEIHRDQPSPVNVLRAAAAYDRAFAPHHT